MTFREDGMQCSAVLSDDRVYRYLLIRQWDYFNKTRGLVAFVGLNPSTADETEDDPTVRRCIGYARDWGFGGLAMLNIFAFRATDPRIMEAHHQPVGPENDAWLERWTAGSAADLVVACWGTHGALHDRGLAVRSLLHDLPLRVFGVTKDGHPKHPLYLRKTQELVPWT